MTSLSGSAGVCDHRRAEMSPHQHGGQHRHVKVRQELHHALREAGYQPGGSQKEAEQTHDLVRKDSLLSSG